MSLAALAQLMVDTTGRIVPGSFRVPTFTRDEFTVAVRAALDTVRYEPVRPNGRKVWPLARQPLHFRLDQGNARR